MWISVGWFYVKMGRPTSGRNATWNFAYTPEKTDFEAGGISSRELILRQQGPEYGLQAHGANKEYYYGDL